MSLQFKRCIKRDEGTNATYVEVTENNVQQIRTLWKKPEAEIGQMLVRFGVGNSKLIDSERFERYYRLPR